jgi:hypothetical protein
MSQINIYLTGTERERTSKYAREFGLDVTALCNLLVRRELRNPRLRSTVRPDLTEATKRASKATAHLPASEKAEFAKHTKQLGLSQSSAGALLVHIELEERWLCKALDG